MAHTESPLIEHLQSRLAAAFSSALGERLVALAAYGSSVDGSFIPAFSDFDLTVFLHGEFGVSDAIAAQEALGDLQPTPFDYLQTKFVNVHEPPRRMLVAGNFSVFLGELPADPRYLHDDESLWQSGERWIQALPRLIAEDTAAWSVAAGSARRQRVVRLMMTRLKPALRATLVKQGEPPAATWLAGWNELAIRWREHDADAADKLASVLRLLPPRTHGQEVASSIASNRSQPLKQ